MCLIAIVLTACGIETLQSLYTPPPNRQLIAIVLTACGIETGMLRLSRFQYRNCNSTYRLRY